MTKLLLAIIGYGVAIGMGILVMIHGWGVQPVSWGWIICGGIGGTILAALFQMAD